MTSRYALKHSHVVAALSLTVCLLWASTALAKPVAPPPLDGCDTLYQSCMVEADIDRSLCIGKCVDKAMTCRANCPPGPAGAFCRLKCLKNYWRCRTKCMKGYSAAAKQCKQDKLDCEACEPKDAWDAELGACCNEPIWIADCWCPEGFEYTSYEEFHDNGCLAGIGCGCEPGKCSDGSELLCDALAPDCGVGMVPAVIDNCWECVDAETCEAGGPQSCDEWEVWDEELHACCPGAVWIADCWCPPGWNYTSWDELDDNGCLLGYACGCEPGTCSDGSELTCKMAEPQCSDGQVLAVINGCYQCLDAETCEPPTACKDGDTWDEELAACCPDAIWVADCLCEPGYVPMSTTETDDAGCLLGYGCECVLDK